MKQEHVYKNNIYLLFESRLQSLYENPLIRSPMMCLIQGWWTLDLEFKRGSRGLVRDWWTLALILVMWRDRLSWWLDDSPRVYRLLNFLSDFSCFSKVPLLIWWRGIYSVCISLDLECIDDRAFNVLPYLYN